MTIPVLAAVGIGMAAEAMTGIGKKVTKMVTGSSKKRTTTKTKTKRSTTPSTSGKKANGTLKKGYRYAKGGRVVKAKK